jgi:hypothetical protein
LLVFSFQFSVFREESRENAEEEGNPESHERGTKEEGGRRRNAEVESFQFSVFRERLAWL